MNKRLFFVSRRLYFNHHSCPPGWRRSDGCRTLVLLHAVVRVLRTI